MEYNEIIEKHSGKFGVFRADCYKRPEKEIAQLFVDAFDNYIDAYNLCENTKYSIHLIPVLQNKTYKNG